MFHLTIGLLLELSVGIACTILSLVLIAILWLSSRRVPGAPVGCHVVLLLPMIGAGVFLILHALLKMA